MVAEKLKEGEVFLTVQLFGKNGPKISCFPFKDAQGNVRFFRGDGVIVFKNKKKAESARSPKEEEF
jgi:hypothetical protein